MDVMKSNKGGVWEIADTHNTILSHNCVSESRRKTVEEKEEPPGSGRCEKTETTDEARDASYGQNHWAWWPFGRKIQEISVV